MPTHGAGSSALPESIQTTTTSEYVGSGPSSRLDRASALRHHINNIGPREETIHNNPFQNKIFNVESAVSQGKSRIYGLNNTLQTIQTAFGLGNSSPASASPQPTQSEQLSSATPSVPPLQAGASAVQFWVNSTAGSAPSATAATRPTARNSSSAQTDPVPSGSTQINTSNSPYLPRILRTVPWVNNATYRYGSGTAKLGAAAEVGTGIGYPFRRSTMSSQTGYASPTLKVSKFILICSKTAQR